jgi:hypothetical protein
VRVHADMHNAYGWLDGWWTTSTDESAAYL